MNSIWIILLCVIKIINGHNDNINKTTTVVRNCSNNIYTNFINDNLKTAAIDITSINSAASANKSANLSVNNINLDYYEKQALSVDLKENCYEAGKLV